MKSKHQIDNARLTAFIKKIPDISRAERAVLSYYKTLYIKHGTKALHPSISTVAKQSNYCERTVIRAIQVLVECKFLKLVGNEKGGSGKARLYFFMELAVIDAGSGYQYGTAKRVTKRLPKVSLKSSGMDIAIRIEEMSPFLPPKKGDKMSDNVNLRVSPLTSTDCSQSKPTTEIVIESNGAIANLSKPKTPSQGNGSSKNHSHGKGQLAESAKPHPSPKRIAGNLIDLSQWNHKGAAWN